MFYALENKRWVSLIRGEGACDLHATSTAGCIVVQADLTDMHMLRPPLRIKEFLLGARCGDATVTNAVYIALRHTQIFVVVTRPFLRDIICDDLLETICF